MSETIHHDYQTHYHFSSGNLIFSAKWFETSRTSEQNNFFIPSQNDLITIYLPWCGLDYVHWQNPYWEHHHFFPSPSSRQDSSRLRLHCSTRLKCWKKKNEKNKSVKNNVEILQAIGTVSMATNVAVPIPTLYFEMVIWNAVIWLKMKSTSDGDKHNHQKQSQHFDIHFFPPSLWMDAVQLLWVLNW